MANDNGSYIGRYFIKDIIAQTPSSIVQKAVDNCNKTYAVKIVSRRKLEKMGWFLNRLPPRLRRLSQPDHVPTPEQRVLREIKVLKKLRHRNIIRLFEVLDDCDNIYLILEYMENGPVMHPLSTETPLSEDVALAYFRDTLDGIEYLHCNKIVHLDLKPSNLLRTKDNRVKISDFGICQEFAESENDLLTYFGQGTPSFRSPESLKCPKSFKISGRAVDVWCLGVTLYVMVHGKLPFHSNDDANSIQIYHSIINDSVIISLRLTPKLRHLLKGMLSKDPVTRLSLRDIRRHHWLTVDF